MDTLEFYPGFDSLVENGAIFITADDILHFANRQFGVWDPSKCTLTLWRDP